MTNLELAADVMASLEMNPGQPSDLTDLVATAHKRSFLMTNADKALGGRDAYLLTYLREQVTDERRQHWSKAIHELAERGVAAVVAGEPDYPRLLASCWDAPPVLFVEGSLPLDGNAVAIVGSRRTNEDVLRDAYELAGAIADAGTTVVSGLARGVDSAAHAGALDSGGRTVAILGTGIGNVYPPENLELARRIARSGGLASQFRPGAPAGGSTFLMRNHVIAGLARTSIVMGASQQSGSRYEASVAAQYGRKVLFWAPSLESQEWAVAAVKAGEASFVSSIDDAVRLA